MGEQNGSASKAPPPRSRSNSDASRSSYGSSRRTHTSPSGSEEASRSPPRGSKDSAVSGVESTSSQRNSSSIGARAPPQTRNNCVDTAEAQSEDFMDEPLESEEESAEDAAKDDEANYDEDVEDEEDQEDDAYVSRGSESSSRPCSGLAAESEEES